MSSIGRMVRVALGRPESETLSFHQLRDALLALHGNISAAARAANISRRTWRYWHEQEARGKLVQPKPQTVTALRSGLFASTAPRDADVIVTTQDRQDPTRYREIADLTSAATWVEVARTLASTVDSEYPAGDAERAGRIWFDGITDEWYQGYFLPWPSDFGSGEDYTRYYGDVCPIDAVEYEEYMLASGHNSKPSDPRGVIVGVKIGQQGKELRV